MNAVMGYTHYWYKKEKLPQAQWDQFTDRLSGLFANSLVTCLESDTENLPPKINADEVCFNGKGADGHETFRFTRVVTGITEWTVMSNDEEGRFFDCCKTAQKHYDYYVVRVLALAEDIFGSDVDVKSDGDWGEIKKTIESSDYYAQNGRMKASTDNATLNLKKNIRDTIFDYFTQSGEGDEIAEELCERVDKQFEKIEHK